MLEAERRRLRLAFKRFKYRVRRDPVYAVFLALCALLIVGAVIGLEAHFASNNGTVATNPATVQTAASATGVDTTAVNNLSSRINASLGLPAGFSGSASSFSHQNNAAAVSSVVSELLTSTTVNTYANAPATSVNNPQVLGAGTVATWIGTLNTNWNDSRNWSPAVVPGAGSDVGIESSPYGRWPVINVNASLNSLTIGTIAYATLIHQIDVTFTVATNVTIGPYGAISPAHGIQGDISNFGNLTINAAGNIYVAPGGYIDGSGHGNNGTGTNGTGSCCAATGASHGGRGGNSILLSNGSTFGTGQNRIYGSATSPTTAGSAATFDLNPPHGGFGGNAIRLNSTAGTIQIDGTVQSNGLSGFYLSGSPALGGGSGGSIWVTAPTVIGSGNLNATGGNGTASTTVYGGGGGGGRIAVTPTGGLTPTINQVSPTSGNANGGDAIAIYGTNFTPTSIVLFGSRSATSVQYINSTVIVATSPPALGPGAVDITVSNAYGFSGTFNVNGGVGGQNGGNGSISIGQSATLSQGFTYYTQPTITSVSPVNGNIGGTGTLIVNGTNFDTTTAVTIGGQAVATTFVTANRVNAVIPAALSGGPTDVTVTNNGLHSSTLSGAYDYIPRLIFSSAALSQSANQPGLVSLTLTDGSGNATTSSENLTVNLTTTSGGGQFSLATAPWSAISSVTIPAGQSTFSFYYRDSVKASPTITITQAALPSITATQVESITSQYRFRVTGVSDPVKSGVPSSVTVQAVDFAGNPLTDYVGTVHFTSTDGFAILPANFTFTSAMLGVHTFVNGVTMSTVGEWRVTATDASDASITGFQDNITVTSPNAGTISQLVIITAPQSFATTSHSSAITVQAQDAGGNPIPVATAKTLYAYRTTTTGSFSLDGVSTYSNPGTVGTAYVMTIPAHASSVSVYYKDTTAGTPTLTFRDDFGTGADFGWTNASQTETVGVGNALKYLLSVASQPRSGQWVAVTATLADSNNATVTALENTDAFFTRVSATGRFSLDSGGSNPVTTLDAPIAAGTSQVTVYFMDTVYHTTPVTVSDSSPANGATGLVDATLSITITPPFSRLVFSGGPSSVTKTQASSAYAVQAQDSVGNVVTMPADYTVYIYSSSGTGTFATASGGPFTVTSLTILSGASTTTFYYKDSVMGTPTLTVSDHTPLDSPDIDIVNATKNITVTDLPPTQLVFTTSPQTIATATASGLITVEARHADNSVAILATAHAVALSSSVTSGHAGTIVKFMATANVNAPAITTVTIPAGSSSASFYYTDNGYGGRTLFAILGALPAASQALTVQSGAPTQLAFTSNPQIVQAGYASGQYSVAVQDSLGNLSALTAGKTVSLSSSCGTGQFSAAAPPSWTPISALALPSGTQTFSFYYRDSAGGACTLLASGSGLASASQLVTILPPPIKIAFTQAPPTIARGQSAVTLNIGLEDLNGNLAPSPVAHTIYFTTTSGTGVFSRTSVVIPADRMTASVTYVDTVIGTATLTAADQNGGPDTGLIDGTTTFTVGYGAVHGIIVSPSQATQQNGNLNRFTLTFTNQFGSAAPADQDLSIVLSSQMSTGFFYDAAGTTNIGANPTIIVPSGSNSATFWYGGAAQSTNISATYVSVFGTARVTVIPDNAYKLVILSSGGTSFTAGQTANMSVAVEDVFGDYVPLTSDLTVFLATDSGTGTIPASVTIHNGAYQAAFTYLDVGAGNFNLTASDFPLPQASDLGLVNGTLAITYAAGTAVKVGLHPVSNSLYINDRVRVNVSTDNSFDNPVTVGADTTVTLTTSAGTGHYYDGAGSATVITSVVIPNGQTSVPVWYSQTAGGATTLTGNSTGLTDGHAFLTVNSTSARSLSISPSPAGIVTDQVSTVTITLRDSGNAATSEAAPRTVYLSTDSPTAVFPTTATIIAGNSSVNVSFSDTTAGTWNITAGDHPLPESPDLGLTNATSQITVGNGVASQLGWENVPTQIERGQVLQLRLALENPYGGEVVSGSGFTAYLNTSAVPGQFATDPNGTWGISSLTFPAGVSSVAVYYRDFTSVTTFRLTASDVSTPPEVPDTGLTNAVANILEVYGDATQLAWINPPATLPVTHTSPLFQVELRNADGQPTPAQGDTAVYLDGGGPAGNQFSANGITGWGATSVTIHIGSTRTNVYFRSQTEGLATITASDKVQISPDTGLTNAVATVDIQHQVLDHLLVTNISTPQNQGTPTSVVVVAEDAQNYPVSWYGGTIHFTSDDPSYTSLPADYTFVPATDLGTHTFTNGVIFARPGIKAVTATDSGNSISGTQSGIIVNGASGNAVAKLIFVAPATQPLTVAQNAVSDVITLETLDSSNQPTVAPAGGLAVHLTSNGTGGRFSATPSGTFTSTLDLTIGAGISAVNLYYRDSNAGSFTITGRDWQGGVDSPTIANATLNVTVSPNVGPTPSAIPGAPQTGRKVTLSSSHIGDPNLAFQWHPGLSTTIKAIRVKLCNDPSNSVACVKPTGADMTSTTLVSTGGDLGSGWTFTVLADNEVLLTKAAGAAVTAGNIQTVNLTGFVNPTSIGTFFFRVTTYSTTAAAPADTVDYGAVAASTARTLTPTVDVAEALVFRVANAVAADCSSQTDIADPNDSGSDLVVLSPQTMTMSTTSIGSAQMCATSNAGNGFVISYYDGARGGASKGFYNGAHEFAVANQFSSATGTEQFGFNLRANTVPSVGFDPDGNGLLADLTNPDYATVNKYSYNDSGLFTTLASKTAPNSASARYSLSYVANISATTPGGTYKAHQIFVITATY